MMSWKGSNTESIGTYLVAGFKNAKLVQLISIPFFSDISGGMLGPLPKAEFADFRKLFQRRSSFDRDDYFEDELSRDLLFDELRLLTPKRILRLRPRHLIYGIGVLRVHYPIAFWLAVMLGTIGSIFGVIWLRRGSAEPSARRSRDDTTVHVDE